MPTHAEDARLPAKERSLYESDLQALQGRAHELGLARSEAWRALLHYKVHPLTGRDRSLADDAGFFASPVGHLDAQAELDATLAVFFEDKPHWAGEQTAQCRFPARLAWLRKELGPLADRLPQQSCARFEQWREGMDPRSVSLIFPTAYVNSPASMYGHTFLRINRAGVGSNNPMLAYTISYAANGSEAEGLGFAFKGLTGLYAGIFTTTPYYRRIEEYTHLENRDIWEYDLSLSKPEIEQLLAHAWELGFTRFDYYFFDENCSYHLLSLLDVARPGLQLTDRFTWWALPVDTVKVLFDEPGLVLQTHYRPSNSSELAWRAAGLRPHAVALARAIGEGREDAGAAQALGRTTHEPALVLELAERVVTYRGAKGQMDAQSTQTRRMALLQARSRLPAMVPVLPPEPVPPHEGHGTARLDAAVGERDGHAQWRLGWRAAYHDLNDPEKGYSRGAQIQFGALELSGESGRGVRFERLLPVDILSLTPHDELLGSTSWKVRFGLVRAFADRGPQAPLAVEINGGPGAAWELGARSRLLVYALMDNQLWWDKTLLQRPWAVGTGVHLGAVMDPMPRWRWHAQARWRQLAGPGAPSEWSLSLHQRFALNDRHNLVASCERQHRQSQPSKRDCLLGLQTYW